MKKPDFNDYDFNDYESQWQLTEDIVKYVEQKSKGVGYTMSDYQEVISGLYEYAKKEGKETPCENLSFKEIILKVYEFLIPWQGIQESIYKREVYIYFYEVMKNLEKAIEALDDSQDLIDDK
jgi:hypothetical protein